MKPGILEKLIPALDNIDGFLTRFGPMKKSVDLKERLHRYKSGDLETDDFFEGYLSVDRQFEFEDLHNKFGLDSTMFPENLMKEILKLKEIALIINEGFE